MILFYIVVILFFIICIFQNIKRFVENHKPIIEFQLSGKSYLIYAKRIVYRFNQNITYSLKIDNVYIGNFGTLNDILIYLNLEKFPN